MIKVRDKISETQRAVKSIRSVRDQLESVTESMAEAGLGVEAKETALEIGGTLTEIEEALLQTKQGDLANIKPKLTNQWAWLYGMMADSDHRPTDSAYERFDDLSKELDEHLRNLQEVLGAM